MDEFFPISFVHYQKRFMLVFVFHNKKDLLSLIWFLTSNFVSPKKHYWIRNYIQ